MKRFSLAVAILLLGGTLLASIAVLPEKVRATTLYVGGTGLGNYSTIQEAIDDANPGDTVYVYNGTYYEHVSVYKTLSLVGEDRALTIINGSGTGDVINVISDSVNITGFTVVDSGPDWFDAGIELYYVKNCYVAKNDIIYYGSRGILLYTSANNTVAYNNVSLSPYDGILLWDSSQNNILGNHISDAYDGISLTNSSRNTIGNNNISHNYHGLFGSGSNNNITRNMFISNRGSAISFLGSMGNSISGNNIINSTIGIDLSGSHDHHIVDNTASKNEVAVISLGYSVDITISNNTMVDRGITMYGNSLKYWNTHTIDTSNTVNGRPLYYWRNLTGGTIPLGAGQVILANCSGVTIENQVISNSTGAILLGFSPNNTIMNNIAFSNYYAGIILMHSENNTVKGNDVFHNLDDGLSLYYSNGTTVVNNRAYRNDFDGIYIAASNDVIVVENLVTDNMKAGIYVDYVSDNTITENTISSNGDIGLYFRGACHRNMVTNNTIHSHEHGFYLWSSNNNIIANNTILMSNDTGIYMRPNSRFNRVYHNSFIDNARQAYDGTSLNEWDDSYPSGGNYWSDYTGADVMMGPNQDIPGSDGIGDTPYPIDVNREDRYPLMAPPVTVAPLPPMMLGADLTGTGLEHVTLRWSFSPDDGGGLRSVVGYEIRRNVSYDSNGLGYNPIALLPNGTSEFTDVFVGEGDPNNYFYQVCALDANDSATCAKDQAGKFTQSLLEGPNIVSVPLIQSDRSVETVLQTVEYNGAWCYDSFSQEWKWFMKFKDYRRGLWKINHMVGLWVNATRESNLTVAGIVPPRTTTQLAAGWNLVSFPSFITTYTVADLKAETGATRVEGFDSSAPPHFLKVLADGEMLQAGYGYWVHVKSDVTWKVTAS